MKPKKIKPNVIPFIPLRDMVVYPHMIVSLFVGRKKTIRALEESMRQDRKIALAAQRQARIDDPAVGDIYDVGTLVKIHRVLKMPDNSFEVQAEGQERICIRKFFDGDKYFTVNYEVIPSEIQSGAIVRAAMRNTLELFGKYVRLSKNIPAEIITSLNQRKDPHGLADIMAAQISAPVDKKQKLLELVNPMARLEALAELLNDEIEIREIERRIKGRVRRQMDNTQKEYYLNEQIKAIRKELGQKDVASENEELAHRITAAQMPKGSADKAMKELARLDRMPPMSPEATVTRTYIEWLVSLPWSFKTREKLDLRVVARTLDKDHFGLRKVKDRILEYLAVRKLAPKMKGPILCLVGPPGVGKTSLARSVAAAINRNFVRISLGGVRDEAEIRGHRRTYIGALPGRIIQSLKNAKSRNPVFLLDEIDKMGSDFRGDPASALLEVLDPEQNDAFNDHYLDLDFDLSEIMFIATANIFQNIHPTLRDRMEIIEIPGYTQEEKIQIAERHLCSRLLEEHGLTTQDLVLSRPIIEKIIAEYTFEAGVRNLNREISALMRKVTRAKVEKKSYLKSKNLTAKDLTKLLGPPKRLWRKGEKTDVVGIATGLAWTENGGEIMAIEVVRLPGKGQLMLTGKLGEVMKESGQAAVSYARKHVKDFLIPPDFYHNSDIHIHVPE
ncbi:endopeptidase La, partial [bacterium]|nr:endopeptidase La [bacterium]